MQTWRGYENIANPPIEIHGEASTVAPTVNPIEFILEGDLRGRTIRLSMKVDMNANDNKIFIDNESLMIEGTTVFERDHNGNLYNGQNNLLADKIPPGRSCVDNYVVSTKDEKGHFSAVLIMLSVVRWQFVTLKPYWMGEPRPQQRTSGSIRLLEGGSNIAEYLLDIRRRDEDAFDGIVETLLHVLPYASGLQPILTTELERAVHLEMTEQEYNIKGWLLSTGTLRILALLALFRDPEPPPLIVIEEIENGLDPRAIHLIVDEIQDLVESGRSQVIVTTHSPYLLDLLPLSSIVLVERKGGEPTFSRPADRDELENWSQRFSPGRLYTMGALSHEDG